MKIKEIGTTITGKTPSTSNPMFFDGSIPFITPEDLAQKYIITSTKRFLSEDGFQSIKNNTLEGISVLVGCIGSDMGNVGITVGKCATNQQINAITKFVSGVNPYFIYYYLSMHKTYLRQIAGMTTTPILSKSFFDEIEIPIPTLEKQDKIVSILKTLDDKISLNNSIISKLEEMAKTIYEYWFLQFDFPNSEGKPYASLGGAMKYSEELGREIPIDWEVITLGSLLERNSSAFDYSSTQPTIDLSVMPQGSIMLNQLNSSDNFATNLFEMKEGDILFGSIRPYLKKAGIAPCNGVYAGTVYSYRPKNEDDFNFAIITMCRNSFFDYAVQISQGTKMPVVKSENLMDYKLAYNPKISKQFNQTIQLKKIICSKAQENQKLAQLRDWLLPMLMNGQVRVE